MGVVFFRSGSGREPVRDWLLEMSREDRKSVGSDIKATQYGWPVGLPLVRKVEPGIWEVRSRIEAGAARVMFTVDGDDMILLHGFVKKSMATPAAELRTTRRRMARLRGRG